MKAATALIFALLAWAGLALAGNAFAAAGDPIELQAKYGRYYQTTLVNEDGTSVETIEWSRTVLKESALESTKHASVSYSTSAEKGEVIAAYTLKADGRRIDVPKNNYQVEINKGRDKDSPVYSDWTTLSVVFPDVAVGDTVVFSYKVTQTEPLFPKQYSAAGTFSEQAAYDDVRVRFEYPAAMWVQYEAHGMKEAESSTKGNRKVVEWRYANPKPVRPERRDYSVFDPDKSVGYAFSTFKTYADIATAYGERAQPKAAVTERIAKLAAEIVKDKKAPKEQARALYEWVSKNITYAGNCIGVGAVVPRDLTFVLDNKMGDCKDHATLLQALLAARNIRSVQALVNAGSVYRLPKTPVVSTVNHVINYLPDFDLYVDATSDSTPFGMLPYGDQDKPVLLVEGYKDGTKTPAMAVGSNRQRVVSHIKIAPDGTASGSLEVFQNGDGAVGMRAAMRNLPKDVEQDLVKNVLRRQGMIGSGTFVKDDPAELTDAYHYKISFDAEKYVKLPGAGAFYIFPPLGMAEGIPYVLRPSLQEIEKEADVTCSNISVVEDYTIELPKGVKVLSVPDNMKISSELLTYTATYKLKGNVLTVRRMLDDRTRGNVCSPQVMAEYKKIADKAMENLKEQVLYK